MGLRMKRRAVTTQEAAVEDDRNAGLQIGSVGVRGQLMNTHSKQASQQWRCELCTPCTWDLQVASLFSFKSGNRDSQEASRSEKLGSVGRFHWHSQGMSAFQTFFFMLHYKRK